MVKQDILLTRLKFISKIKIGDKINTRHHLTIQPNNFLTSISRTIILQDSRTNALHFISDTISQSIDIINNIKNSNKSVDVNLLKLLLNDIRNAKNGINNISETYSDDLIIVSEFETIIQSIDFILEEIEDKSKSNLNSPITNPIEIDKDEIQSQPSSLPDTLDTNSFLPNLTYNPDF